jgi:serine/threonine-protein phosphatase 2A regulatory subunit B''|mmetsp:Transcript_49518/g.146282  ORF Transcript_49518/g.146282 Transcript_49518/m.146282 type:complete len:606 (-) Transcript_49518:46-1863(-)
MAVQGASSDFVRCKLDEFFWEWLSLPESQKLVRQAVNAAKTGEAGKAEADIFQSGRGGTPAPSPHFSGVRSSPSGRPSPPGSPHARGIVRDSLSASDSSLDSWQSTAAPSTAGSHPTSPRKAGQQAPAPSIEVAAAPAKSEPSPPSPTSCAVTPGGDEATSKIGVGESMLANGSKEIPRFWWPKRQRPTEALSPETREKIHNHFVKEGITDGIRTYQQLEYIVTDIFKLSKYFVVPIFHKIKVFYNIVDSAITKKAALLNPSPMPITEQMLIGWCNGKVQPDDLVLSFFYVVKKEHNDWIEREDFSVFLIAILLTHPGLDFLRETAEFQDRYADTVISRIFFVYDRKDVGRIYLSSLRRHRPSVTETWKQLADHDDIKMVRDYFSYEHFYVIYCTFWELDSDHDFLLDKDDLLKYDGHALSRRTVDRIFSESPTKFTSAVPGKMGYEDFIRFLLCDQDRQTDRSMEYWFHVFDLDGDGSIRDHEMKYFYEEQVQRMECLNYDTIPFADILCQMNDMIAPKAEGVFRLADFKKRRKFAGTFFSLFSSLNKFLAFEHRDPFLAKQEQLDNPSFSEWDRWCADEYLRLAMEEGEEPDEDRGGDDSGGG